MAKWWKIPRLKLPSVDREFLARRGHRYVLQTTLSVEECQRRIEAASVRLPWWRSRPTLKESFMELLGPKNYLVRFRRNQFELYLRSPWAIGASRPCIDGSVLPAWQATRISASYHGFNVELVSLLPLALLVTAMVWVCLWMATGLGTPGLDWREIVFVFALPIMLVGINVVAGWLNAVLHREERMVHFLKTTCEAQVIQSGVQ